MMVIILFKLTMVNPDRNIFLINVELTSTFLLYKGFVHHHHRIGNIKETQKQYQNKKYFYTWKMKIVFFCILWNFSLFNNKIFWGNFHKKINYIHWYNLSRFNRNRVKFWTFMHIFIMYKKYWALKFKIENYSKFFHPAYQIKITRLLGASCLTFLSQF